MKTVFTYCIAAFHLTQPKKTLTQNILCTILHISHKIHQVMVKAESIRLLNPVK